MVAGVILQSQSCHTVPPSRDREKLFHQILLYLCSEGENLTLQWAICTLYPYTAVPRVSAADLKNSPDLRIGRQTEAHRYNSNKKRNSTSYTCGQAPSRSQHFFFDSSQFHLRKVKEKQDNFS